MRESPFVRDRRRPSTALVTGGAGFVGSAVVRRLRRDGVRVVVLDALTSAGSHARLEASLGANCLFVEGDVTDARAVAELLRRVRPDVVFHLAAETRDDRSSDPLRLVHANVVGTAVLLDEGLRYWSELPASRRNAFRFIQVSSDDVFGGLGAHGLFSASTPHRPSSPGAASRSAAGLLAGSWYRTHGFPAIVTHGAENFGPHQFPEQFIPRAIRRALQYDAVRVTGAGDQSRDWLFVGDHADGLVAAWRRGLPGQTYLFGGGEERQDLHVAREICSLV
ncbi:MAG: SDR family NAD(P)-dependent oxidoreductase, partial [Gemmatimonadetes bacterium]|nr:SDR family NAD(P)-dependent oxidoreductase [Gemmatimonadota bacterium]